MSHGGVVVPDGAFRLSATRRALLVELDSQAAIAVLHDSITIGPAGTPVTFVPADPVMRMNGALIQSALTTGGAWKWPPLDFGWPYPNPAGAWAISQQVSIR